MALVPVTGTAAYPHDPQRPIGHAHEGITVQIYGHRSTGHDRDAAELVAGLIRARLTAPDADAG